MLQKVAAWESHRSLPPELDSPIRWGLPRLPAAPLGVAKRPGSPREPVIYRLIVTFDPNDAWLFPNRLLAPLHNLGYDGMSRSTPGGTRRCQAMTIRKGPAPDPTGPFRPPRRPIRSTNT